MKYKSILAMLWIGVIITGGATAEGAEVIKTFPFGKPFEFSTSWDEVEGPKPGPFRLRFIDREHCVVLDSMSYTWHFFDSNWNPIGTQTIGFGPQFISMGYRYLLIGMALKLGEQGQGAHFRVYPRQGPYTNALAEVSYEPPSRKESSGIPLYVTGQWVFSSTPDNQLISWELPEGGGSPLFRNAAATEAWMKQGNGESLGYSFKFNYYHFFGGNAFSLSPANYLPHGYFSSGFDISDGVKHKITSRSAISYFDQDGKGLHYFYLIGPNTQLGLEYDRPAINQHGMQLIFGIADPWTKQFVFRALPAGAWNPPRTEEKGLLGLYGRAVDPDGNIYFFDADASRHVYELKRVENTWWAELGVDKRTVGVVTENRVRLRSKPGTASSVVGHGYENEYAWVLEQGKGMDTIGGSTAPWMKVRLVDGREGWIFGAFVDIQE